MRFPRVKSFVVWLALLAGADTVYPAPPHCTALTGDHCYCPGCSSFRADKKSLIGPPTVPEAVVRPPSDSTTADDWDAARGPQVERPESFAEQIPFNDMSADSGVISPSSPLADASTDLAGGGASPSVSQFAAAFGDSSGAAGIPAMLGDFCGLGSTPIGRDHYYFDNVPGQLPGQGNGTPSQDHHRQAVTTPVAGGDCRHKWAEFTSPLPTDRVFFTYHHYNNGLRDFFFQRGDADLFTVGFEKTFCRGLVSIEKRIGFLGGGLNSTQLFGDTFGGELGNMATSVKGLLWYDNYYAVSSGLTMIWPTGDDGVVPDVMTIRNESVHLMPFMALLYRPNAVWFHQVNVQFDFDATGDTVIGAFGDRDVIQNQTFMYVDYSIGRWLCRNPIGCVRQVAALTELHYSTNLTDADVGNQGLFANVDFNVLNISGGLHLRLSQATDLRVAGGAPLRTDGDRAFDSEIVVQLARYF